MRKIALILALVMCFSVVLVACQDIEGTESTPADTSAPADESKPASDESKPATDESKPADESDTTETSQPTDESKPEVTPSETNIALGKPYTKSQLFRQSTETWSWDETYPEAYPDEDEKSLTDGLMLPETDSYQDPVWAGFSAKCPDYAENGFSYATVDLGEAAQIALVKVGVATAMFGDVGITAPATVEVAFSDDGETWTDAVVAVPTNPTDAACEVVEIPVNNTAKYVQVRTTGSGWLFVSEIEIYPAK